MSESQSSSLLGVSLRKKKSTRPKISGPVLQVSNDGSLSHRTPSPASGRPSSSRERPRPGGDHTSDLVKRRYSTRFANGIPQDGLAPPIPAMPALPNLGGASPSAAPRLRPPPSRDGTKTSPERSKLKIDMRAIRDQNLSIEKYVQNNLSDASENDIHFHQKELRSLQAHTDAELQHYVYHNRTQFIKISKEADKLRTEMRQLRALMTELTGALGHATSAGGVDLDSASALSIADRKRANRSSVANLEAMWSTHLQALWKRVEGSQKYLPALPGRHIILESQRWLELNAATWKPRRRVALVLLNDHLLVAAEKKNLAQNAPAKSNRMSVYNPQLQSAFAADRCFPLHDVTLSDTSARTPNGAQDSRPGTISNAISLRAGSESFTYAVADSSDKAGFVVAFRKAQEDQRKLISAEHGEREKGLDELAYMAGRDPRLLKKAAAAAASTDPNGVDFKPGSLNRSGSVLVDVDGRPQSIRWVESQIDGLDIDIALQHFEEAVSRVEKLRTVARSIKGNNVAQEIVHAKVNERASRLANSVARRLRQNSGGMEQTKKSVNWLLRLGYEELARKTYLTSRTETIRTRSRQLPFTGALEPYMQALSYVAMSLLVNTFKTFHSAFPASSGSAVVRWAKECVDEFNTALERQLSGVERGSEVWNRCIAIAQEQANILNEVGVDFSGIVARNLRTEGTGST